MRKRDQQNLVKVGLFLSALTFIMMLMVTLIGKETSFFIPKVDLYAQVKSVGNLKPGATVELRGIRVGSVTNIDIISEEEIGITLRITETHLKWIKKDSRISISTAGLLGDKFLEILGGSKDSPQFDPTKDRLESEEQMDFKKIVGKGESIATKVERVLDKVDTILANMEDGKNLVATINALHKTSLNFEKVSQELTKAPISSSFTKMDKIMGRLDGIMSRVEEGPGTIHSLVYDDGLHEDLRTLLGGAERNKVIKYFIRQSIEQSERKKANP